MRTAVVGHVEWATFTRVDHVPIAGEIVHGEDVFDAPAGGGPVAAVQLLKLAGECTFYTALADDDLGHRAYDELCAMGVRVECVFRTDETQRRAFVHVDRDGERTITVLGPRLGPMGAEPLPWNELGDVDACYFCAGDDEALRLARRAKVLVATSRESERLVRTGVRLDAVVGSAKDQSETYVPITPEPDLVVMTRGREGGLYTRHGDTGTFDAEPLPGPIGDTYGAGDSFAAGLTYALGAQMTTGEALAFAAKCGAATMTGRGPYEGQLTR